MTKINLILLWCTIFLTPIVNASEYSTKYSESYALVVGINKYSLWPQLEYATKDALEIAYLLKEQGFQVETLLDSKATKASIWQHLENYKKKAKLNSRIVFYFAGHGQTEDMPSGGEQGYIVPVNADLYDWDSTMLSMKDINGLVQNYKSKHILLVFDSCYSGLGLTRGIRVAKKSQESGYIQKMHQLDSIQVLTAGGRAEQAIEAEGHGLFTDHLLAALSGVADINTDGFTTGTEIYATIRPSVTRKSFNRQTPQFGYLRGEGDMIFSTSSKKNQQKSTLLIDSKVSGIDVWIDTKEMASQIPSSRNFKIQTVSGRHRILVKKGGKTLYSKTVYLPANKEYHVKISSETSPSKHLAYSMYSIVSKNVSNFSQSMAYDLDNDGNEEIVSISGTELFIYNKKGKLLTSKSFNYKIRLDLVKEWQGKAVIAVSGKYNGDVVLSLLDSSLNKVWSHTRRITKKYQGKPDGGGRIAEIADINNDGKEEVIAFSSAGYAWKPRGIIVYDYRAKEMWRYLTGPGPTGIAIWKNKYGNTDLIIGTYSPGNGNKERHNNTDDQHCYIISVDSDGKTNWVINVGTHFTGSKVLLADLDSDGEEELYAYKWTAYNYRKDEGAIYKISRAGNIINKFQQRDSIKSLISMGFSPKNRALYASDKSGTIVKLDSSLDVLEKRNMNKSSTPLIINLVGAHDYDGDKKPELLFYSYNRFQKGKNPRSDYGPRNKVIYSDMKYQVLSEDLSEIEKETFIAEKWNKWRGFKIIDLNRPEMPLYPFMVLSDKITIFNL